MSSLELAREVVAFFHSSRAVLRHWCTSWKLRSGRQSVSLSTKVCSAALRHTMHGRKIHAEAETARVVASALGEFRAARRSAGGDKRSPHHVFERSTLPRDHCAVFIKDSQEAVRLADGEAGQARS